ncbi:hypothetical protein, partial [Hoylesella buccalis]|uniref:hypothetical protein n=1 Tax=Hoylesella buccalis TaxID=28127 RepID=UPI00050FCB5E
DFLTRTSMNRQDIGKEGAFLWEPKDVIYVEDDKGKLCKSQNEITESAPRTTFLVDGSYTKQEYNVYYYGTNTSAGEKKVVIANNQTQAAFNNTKHFGAVGDCGVAKATKTTVAGESGYSFDLAHKASYLCFLPYIPTQENRNAYKIKSIEIRSGSNIAGTYELTQNGLSKGTNESNKITLKVGTDGLMLANKATGAKSIENSLYAVIAPGTYSLKVDYTVIDTKTNEEKIITKYYQPHNFVANKICDIPVCLGSIDLCSGYNYYMWDAKENYWSEQEWDNIKPSNRRQPTPDKPYVEGAYPQCKADAGDRWYHEGVGPLEASNTLFKKLPNANEMAWYILKGCAFWDDTKQWTAFGTTYTGGIWLKKLSVIANENGKNRDDLKKADPFGSDLRTNNPDPLHPIYYSATIGRPTDSEINSYFFLPALGNYHEGNLEDNTFTSVGLYWSSSVPNDDPKLAYSMFFGPGSVMLQRTDRAHGCVAQPFE